MISDFQWFTFDKNRRETNERFVSSRRDTAEIMLWQIDDWRLQIWQQQKIMLNHTKVNIRNTNKYPILILLHLLYCYQLCRLPRWLSCYFLFCLCFVFIGQKWFDAQTKEESTLDNLKNSIVILQDKINQQIVMEYEITRRHTIKKYAKNDTRWRTCWWELLRWRSYNLKNSFEKKISKKTKKLDFDKVNVVLIVNDVVLCVSYVKKSITACLNLVQDQTVQNFIIMDANSALSMIRNRTSAPLRCPLCRQEWNVFVRVPILKTMIDELKKFKNMNKLEKLRQSFKAAASAMFK